MAKFSPTEVVEDEKEGTDPSTSLFQKISRKYAQHVKDRIAHEDFIEKIQKTKQVKNHK